MADITLDDVLVYAGSLSEFDSARATAIIAGVYIELRRGEWPDEGSLNYAATMLAAHRMVLAKAEDEDEAGGSGVGLLKSVTVGGVTKSFETKGGGGSPLLSGAGLDATSYGKEFQRFREVTFAGAGVWVL
jgi:hypothetical protein